MNPVKSSESKMVLDDDFISENLKHLYDSAVVQDQHEACVVFLHSFMLEWGFLPKDVPENEKFQAMPKNWNARTMYKILYCHQCCQEYTCSVTCIPLYNTLSVFGTVCNTDCHESINVKIELIKYFKDPPIYNVLELGQNLKHLAIYFKDQFCLPLLNLLHESIGCSSRFGLQGLFGEIKNHIIEFLPLKDVLSLSSVNKEFNSLTNQPQLWKYLFLRDFCKDGVPDINMSSEDNWKEEYKNEWLRKRKVYENRVYIPFRPYWNPSNQFYPDFTGDPDPFDPYPYFYPVGPPRLPSLFRRF